MIGRLILIACLAIVVGVALSMGATLFVNGYYPGAVLAVVTAIIVCVFAISQMTVGKREETIPTNLFELVKMPLYEQSLFTFLWIKLFGKSATVTNQLKTTLVEGKEYDNKFFVTQIVFKMKPEIDVRDKNGERAEYMCPIATIGNLIKARLIGEYVQLDRDGLTVTGLLHKRIIYVVEAGIDIAESGE